MEYTFPREAGRSLSLSRSLSSFFSVPTSIGNTCGTVPPNVPLTVSFLLVLLKLSKPKGGDKLLRMYVFYGTLVCSMC